MFPNSIGNKACSCLTNTSSSISLERLKGCNQSHCDLTQICSPGITHREAYLSKFADVPTACHALHMTNSWLKQFLNKDRQTGAHKKTSSFVQAQLQT